MTTPSPIRTNRRQFLIGAGLAAAATAGLTACGSDAESGGEPTDGKGTALEMTWWGNPTRNQNTVDAVAAYMTANPGVTIGTQPGEFASYWDRLATQTAGNTSPDIIQHEVGYVSEYAKRGALLDLEQHGLDLSKFAEGTADSGRVDGVVYGVNAGLNTPVLMANPEVFEKAGVALPDDTTWTWTRPWRPQPRSPRRPGTARTA